LNQLHIAPPNYFMGDWFSARIRANFNAVLDGTAGLHAL
jgi:hypothetical protein